MGFISSSIEGDTTKQNEERGDYVRKGVKQTKKVLYQVGYYCEEVGLVPLETLKPLCGHTLHIYQVERKLGYLSTHSHFTLVEGRLTPW